MATNNKSGSNKKSKTNSYKTKSTNGKKNNGTKKKNRKGAVISVLIIILVIAIVAIASVLYFINDSVNALINDFIVEYLSFSQNKNDVLADSNVSVHFLELGNKYTGDCTLIKCGNTEVLIDAGSRTDSSATLTAYINQYCTDGILEYVIVTHAHQDHIAGFVGSNANPGIFESYVCQTIIDFPLTNANSKIYSSYVTKRNAEIANGATHYNALECWNEVGGAKKEYVLGKGVTLSILYNYYYENTTTNENDYSVCCLLNDNGTYSLFTGDLEKDGESYLVDYNNLPKCKLFKGAHHGSYTASTEKLLSVIQPEIVCVCCCCGTPEYTTNPNNIFPSQSFIDRVVKYTTNIYITTLIVDYDNNVYQSMNGNIVILFNDKGEVAIKCSNNNTKLIDTEWFKSNRVLSS